MAFGTRHGPRERPVRTLVTTAPFGKDRIGTRPGRFPGDQGKQEWPLGSLPQQGCGGFLAVTTGLSGYIDCFSAPVSESETSCLSEPGNRGTGEPGNRWENRGTGRTGTGGGPSSPGPLASRLPGFPVVFTLPSSPCASPEMPSSLPGPRRRREAPQSWPACTPGPRRRSSLAPGE